MAPRPGEPPPLDLAKPDQDWLEPLRRLEADNYTSLVIAYNVKDVVTQIETGDYGCNCPTCTDKAPEVTMEKIKNFAAHLTSHLSIRDAEAMLGEGILHVSVRTTGGQSITHYTLSYRVAERPNGYLFVRGYTASRELEAVDLRSAPLDGSYTLTEFYSDCLGKD
jgi:hypothetical protein